MDLMQGVDFSHWIMSNFLDDYDILVDATCGNGNDTVFLAELVKDDGRIYAFDIQDVAIKNTKNKVNQNHKNVNIEFINDGHENIDKYIKEKINGIIYNLGYLPGSDKNIKTNENTTLSSIKKALDILEYDGIIVLVIYTGHEGGKEERDALISLSEKLDCKSYNVLYYHFINQIKNPAEVLVIKKRGE